MDIALFKFNEKHAHSVKTVSKQLIDFRMTHVRTHVWKPIIKVNAAQMNRLTCQLTPRNKSVEKKCKSTTTDYKKRERNFLTETRSSQKSTASSTCTNSRKHF